MAEIIVQLSEQYVDRKDVIVATLGRVLSSHKFVFEGTPPSLENTILLTSYANLDLGLPALASLASNIHLAVQSDPSIMFESNTSNVSYP